MLKPFALLLFLLASLFAAGEVRAADRVFTKDVVDLIAGKETDGREDLSVMRDAYTYRFATPENKAAFEADPERFAVQYGGACARMGALSGEGDPDRYSIHEGRLYIFASDACRNAFLANPPAYMEPVEPRPTPTPESAAKARSLLDRAAIAMGGNAKINAVRSMRLEENKETRRGENTYKRRSVWTAVFPDQFRYDEEWDGSPFAMIVSGDEGYFTGSSPKIMDESQRRALRRRFAHEPLVIMKARSRPDFVAEYIGPTEFTRLNLEEVAVWFDGVRTVLGIEPATGRIHKVSYAGRGSRSVMGLLEFATEEHERVGEIEIARDNRAYFNGEWNENFRRVLDKIELDVEVPAEHFAPPKPAAN